MGSVRAKKFRCYTGIIMRHFTKHFLYILVTFLVLFSVSPMISKYSECGESLPYMGCALEVKRKIVFPVYRTVVCEVWSRPGCAPDTLLPGWYEGLMNYENAIIIILLFYFATKLSKHYIT